MQLIDINSRTVDLEKYSTVTDDSRKVISGGIFIAVKGELYDGHNFINEALRRGARLIIVDKTRANLNKQISKVPVVEVDNSRLALSYIASQIYDKPENIIAVTGTNGKTSVAYFVQQLLTMLGIKAASIGTLGVISGNKEIKDLTYSLTTPGALQLHEILHNLKNQKTNYVSLEASSHGLVQHRIDHIPFKAAAFTSFSREHLDYHKNMASYLKAKLYLFERLLDSDSFALINSEMKVADKIMKICKYRNIKALTYGYNGNFITIKSIKYLDNAFYVEFSIAGNNYHFVCNLFGEFQIYNILCAVGFLVSLGFDIETILPFLSKLDGIPGRMQRVSLSNVYVDYSHTPDSISNALKSMRDFLKFKNKKGKIIIVFGCGGNRDKGKRSEMGKIPHNLADVVIITDDNPRDEDPSTIRKEIIKACPNAIEVPGREKAIKYAIQNSKPEDLILIAGKGHEKYQIVGGRKFAFDDVKIARKYLDK